MTKSNKTKPKYHKNNKYSAENILQAVSPVIVNNGSALDLSCAYMNNNKDKNKTLDDLQKGVDAFNSILVQLDNFTLPMDISSIKKSIQAKKAELEESMNDIRLSKELSYPSNLPQTNITNRISKGTCESYKGELISTLSKDIWNKLSTDSQRALITAKFSFDSKKKDKDYLDFSDVCIELSKVVDIEATERVFIRYKEYLSKTYDTTSKWPTGLFNDRGELLTDEEFTLGNVVYAIGKSPLRILNKDNYKIFCEYGSSVLYGPAITNSNMNTSIGYICECAEEIRINYRNSAAHRGLSSYNTAKNCMDYLLDVNHMIKYMLKNTAF